MANEQESFESTPYVRASEEALFARDVDGQLIRFTEATLSDLSEEIKLTIDGEPITVKKAVPLRNSQGTVVTNEKGELIPRPTTIYDAVSQVYVKKLGDVNPVPVLCHREHLNPVGVCRVCLVEVSEIRPSGRPRKALVSSCTYHVKNGMVIATLASKKTEDEAAVKTIKSSVGVILDLLASEHLTSEESAQLNKDEPPRGPNELKRLVSLYANDPKISRYAPSHLAGKRGKDPSSEIISVNHDACIMCQRCTRACNDIKQNDVMARDGKGYDTRIAFDNNLTMLESSCVSCGECVISCPTDALTFKPEVVANQVKRLQKSSRRDSAKSQGMTADELLEIPIFSGIPYKFLQFNGAGCVRRVLKPGETLCTQGEYGSTAFLIQGGKFEIQLGKKAAPPQAKSSGIFGFLKRGLGSSSSQAVPSLATGADTKSAADDGPKLYRGAEDVILGEMACLNRYPRTATVVAVEESEVIEIGSNVLYMLQRNTSSRKILNDAYKRHALNSDLERLPIFEKLSQEGRKQAARIISEDVDLISVEPGMPIFKQGAEEGDLFLIRLGYIKVSRQVGTRENVVGYQGPGNLSGEAGSIGEIAALSSIYKEELAEELNRLGYHAGVRTTTCIALDHVELVRIKSSQLKKITEANPEFKDGLMKRARALLAKDANRLSEMDREISNFISQGLYNAQSLLVLDLESCTRCDECTKACADAHGGETRLVREGLRFENFLVATSCRSCTDPYCLVGCPVNSIFREGSKEIVIEDHCIGCGQCASNCPYGNITMYGKEAGFQTDGELKIPIIQQKATTCDQCKSIGGTPRCVHSCPHDAAFRMSGEELRKTVQAKSKS
jgi:Fe-S-cluster-containing hydrogenase component 2/CRP-like cAMP-binding protein